VAVGDTTLEPRALLDALLAIETDFGRERPYPARRARSTSI
jgi:7,8-dihydro-6-hydroxymethylpterin-pyrophosphokinase